MALHTHCFTFHSFGHASRFLIALVRLFAGENNFTLVRLRGYNPG